MMVSCTSQKDTCDLVADKGLDYPTALERLGLRADPDVNMGTVRAVNTFCGSI
jgi:hypothetical protein